MNINKIKRTANQMLSLLSSNDKKKLARLLVVVVIMAIFQAIGVASVLPFISLVTSPDQVQNNYYLGEIYDMFNFNSLHSFTIFLGIVMLALIIITNLISVLTVRLQFRFVWDINHSLSLRLLGYYVNQPYDAMLNQHSSNLGKNVLEEVRSLTGGFYLPVVQLISKVIVSIVIIFLLMLVNLKIAIITALTLGTVYAAIYAIVSPKLKEKGIIRFATNKSRYRSISEIFGGIKEIKVNNRESFFIEKYARLSKIYSNNMTWQATIAEIPRYALEIVAFGGVILLILVQLIKMGTAQSIIPLVSLYVLAGYRLLPALQQIYRSLSIFRFYIPVLERFYNDLSNTDLVNSDLEEELRNTRKHTVSNFLLELENVTYTYPAASRPSVKNISLQISSNMSLGIVGSTGAGKTTLVDVILGLLRQQEGKVLFKGSEICDANIKYWQKIVGYVPQTIYLTDDTIADNIAFGVHKNNINYITVENVAKVANIHDYVINELPDGYMTKVGERGVRLSGGQRQRIGIARALYHNPEIIIFDEATSALDGVTELAVSKALENASNYKTLIVIAHRLTSIQNCDLICLMDNGMIVDRGTYKYLIDNNSFFREMAFKKRNGD